MHRVQAEAIVRSFNRCPHPDCTRTKPSNLFACRQHWFSLPAHIREKITIGFGGSSTAWSQGYEQAMNYWRAHPAAHKKDLPPVKSRDGYGFIRRYMSAPFKLPSHLEVRLIHKGRTSSITLTLDREDGSRLTTLEMIREVRKMKEEMRRQLASEAEATE